MEFIIATYLTVTAVFWIRLILKMGIDLRDRPPDYMAENNMLFFACVTLTVLTLARAIMWPRKVYRIMTGVERW